jgi:hypothetical protein
MTVNYVVHDAIGKILRYGQCPENMVEIQAFEGQTALVGSGNDFTDYVSDGEILPRPTNPATLDGYVLSNVPIPSTLEINGTVFDVTESTVTLDFPNAGVYKLKLTCFPYFDATFEVMK